jgi:cyclopropane fatty-acyl-phospholipid synthase-like methyltransferase
MLDIYNYWIQAHVEQNKDALSGVPFNQVWEYFDLPITEGMDILDIGVGTGTFAKGAHAMGCRVCSLDICNLALSTVTDYIEEGYIHAEIDRLPQNKFDLAVSHLVTIHMTLEEIEKQFSKVIDSLKLNGLFYVQLSGAESKEYNNKQKILRQQCGKMRHNPDVIGKIIRSCGGCVDFYKFKFYENYYFYYAKIWRDI